MVRPWWTFFDEKLALILREKKEILDIGGGLRVDPARSNRRDTVTSAHDLLREDGVSYKVLDYVSTYNPDIVGDVQNLPLPNESQKAIACLSVLEHVENPIKAAQELYRVLEQGGYCLVYVPFLYYYHAERSYYKDYWRFTEDALRFIFKPFSVIEIQSVRGPIEMVVRLLPLSKWGIVENIAFHLDAWFGKLASKQTSGYVVFLQK